MTIADDRSSGDELEKFCKGFLAERTVVRGSAKAGGNDPKNIAIVQRDEHGFARAPTHAYPGLRSFTTREARLFFGRQSEANELRRRLSDSNVVFVLGGSGSGKSSLVLAGVLPRLNDVGRIPGRTGRWYAATFRPGDSPCEKIVEAIWKDVCEPLLALKGGPQAFAEVLFPNSPVAQIDTPQVRSKVDAILKSSEGHLTPEGINTFLEVLERIDERLAKLRETLRAGKVNLLLLIDQFEELFRETVRKEKRKDIETIIDLLEFAGKNPKGPLVIVATLRSEELHRCAEFDRLAPVVNHGFYLIDHPRIGALIEAAVRPGRQTLLDWDVEVTDDDDPAAKALISDGEHAPFSIAFLEKLQDWVEQFQGEDRAEGVEADRHRRHQADFLPLFQHMLRITWGTAVDRWQREGVQRPAIEPLDIENWIRHRQGRVTELRSWMSSLGEQIRASDTTSHPDNLLEACFDTGFAITISEAIAGKSWDQLQKWPPTDAIMTKRLRVVQAAFVALATRDDKGNDARRPATASEMLAASRQPADPQTLQSVLSFFKARNYLHGGEDGERYDVNHEALIRNSSEYQLWLGDAKKVANSLYDANAAIEAGRSSGPGQKVRSGWKTWLLQRYADFTLNRYYDAAERMSGDRCRDLERIFGANAVFDPVWMAERAELPGTKEEQRAAVDRIKGAWEDAHRWRVDFNAGQKVRPSFFQRTTILLKRLWKKASARLAAAMGNVAEQRTTALSGRELLLAKVGAVILTAVLVVPAAVWLIYQFAEYRSSSDALRVLAVTADVVSPRSGDANDHARKQILASGARIEELRGKYLASYVHRRDLTLATAVFDSAARSYLNQIFFSELSPPSPATQPLSCIRSNGSAAVPGYDSISSPSSARKFAVVRVGAEERLVAKFADEIADPKDGVLQVLVGPSIACGVSNLDYLVVWTQLSENSNPLVYPVIWYNDKGREYAKIEPAFQPRNIEPKLSQRITPLGKSIAQSLDSNAVAITAVERDKSHWVVVRIEGPGGFELRFARGVQTPSIVSGPVDGLRECKRVIAADFIKPLVEESECETRPDQQPSTIGIKISSKAFDPDVRTGEADYACNSATDKLCVHRVSISHAPLAGDPFKIQATEINYLIAPPIREAGLEEGYIVFKDAENKFRSIPVEISTLLKIIGELPPPPTPPLGSPPVQPTAICKEFKCEDWMKN